MSLKQLIETQRKRIRHEKQKERLTAVALTAVLGIVLLAFLAMQPKTGGGVYTYDTIEFLNVTNYTTIEGQTKSINLINVGEQSLSDFMIFLNGKRIEPYYAPEMVYPNKEISIILHPEQSDEWDRTEGIILILAKGEGKIQIKASRVPLAGNFAYSIT